MNPKPADLDAGVLAEAHNAAGITVRAPRPHRAQLRQHARVAVACIADTRAGSSGGAVGLLVGPTAEQHNLGANPAYNLSHRLRHAPTFSCATLPAPLHSMQWI